MPAPPSRAPIRTILPSLHLGIYPPGRSNTITDVPGVLVSTQSIQLPASDSHDIVNTGVTAILPRKEWFNRACHAGIHRFNGSGELTGSHWLKETGLLNSPIVLTNSWSVGEAYTGVYKWCAKHYRDLKSGLAEFFILPVVGETYDGMFSDIAAMKVTPDHVVKGIDSASSEPVKQGNTGGGTGNACSGFKGGTGSASRVVESLKPVEGKANEEWEETTFTVGALAQVNFGQKRCLRIGGVPVGRVFQEQDEVEASLSVRKDPQRGEKPNSGSIIVVIATDAPLLPNQLERLAQRATVGVARTGGWGSNTSGDIFLAFSTANEIDTNAERSWKPKAGLRLDAVDDKSIEALLESAADVTEECIYNALTCAETITGPQGFCWDAIDLERLRRIMNRFS